MTEALTLTPQMMVVLGLLGFTIFLFVSEIVPVDVAAIIVMVLLGLVTLIPGMENVADTAHLFDGFASNAVISIIAVMIIGAGLDKTGIMSKVASFILRRGGTTEARIIPMISGTVGIISSFMQNVGAAALFLPVVSRISARTGLPMSRLLMPMGFTAILGGTMTMVGSSPLILLNDLLPEGMEQFGLFDVSAIGIALVATGILYFVLAGRYVLPATRSEGVDGENTMDYLKRVYGLEYNLTEMVVPKDSPLVGKQVQEVERAHRVRLIGLLRGSDMRVAPHREVVIEPGSVLGVLARAEGCAEFAKNNGLQTRRELEAFSETLIPTKAGICEVVIPPRSDLVGKSLSEVWMRKTYGLSVLAIHRGEKTLTQNLRDEVLHAGDTLVCHAYWNALARLEKDRNFVVVTQNYPHEELRPQKVGYAAAFFALAVALILADQFVPGIDIRLSLSLLVGAVGMIITGVLSIEEAYKAVSWKTVFLLASLIPLGAAVQDTGTAAWIAQEVLALLGDVSPWVLQAAIAILATFFTLVMSNVGATVLLVPLAVSIAMAAQASGIDADPRVFALTVAIATSNSFLIPTHQVNALIMGPGGYRVKDYMKAGGIMTVLFLVVSLVMLNVVF
ncbi:MAG: SLC13 family permease [Gammaproteobacteria bacterium]|nr:SLC13 family permease [Gammaproteobacteria bacterium]MDX5375102.1 SLC13 family permease [Gammaproteobacteria bacterium]